MCEWPAPADFQLGFVGTPHGTAGVLASFCLSPVPTFGIKSKPFRVMEKAIASLAPLLPTTLVHQPPQLTASLACRPFPSPSGTLRFYTHARGCPSAWILPHPAPLQPLNPTHLHTQLTAWQIPLSFQNMPQCQNVNEEAKFK